MSQIQKHWALHDVWLGWLKWQILTGIQPPQLLRSVTWRVHTWRMFSLLLDNHSGTILLGPYTRKPIFALLPTLLRIILHFSSGSDPDLMKIHRNKVYHTKLICPDSHFTWYKWHNLDGPSPQHSHGWVCHKQFSTVNAETTPGEWPHLASSDSPQENEGDQGPKEFSSYCWWKKSCTTWDV